MRETPPFRWTIAPGGYSIITSRRRDPSAPRDDKERRYITDGRPLQLRAAGTVIYPPLKEFTGLFRTFTEIGSSTERAVDFANRYGLLGGAHSVWISAGVGDDGKEVIAIGEDAFQWIIESMVMRQVLELWDAARQGNHEHLSRHIIWNENGVHFDSHPDLGTDKPDPPFHRSIASIGTAAEGSTSGGGYFEEGDLIRPALTHVQYVINKHLKDCASPKLLWEQQQTRLGVYVVPHSLIGAMWLQFAEAVERNSKFRECTVCGKWFEIASGAGRADKQFCSAYCRTKAHRERQAEPAPTSVKSRVKEARMSAPPRDRLPKSASKKPRTPKPSR